MTQTSTETKTARVSNRDSAAPVVVVPRSSPSHLATLWEVAIHVAVGTALFAIIAAPAVVLNLGLQQLESTSLSQGVMTCLLIGEYALVIADLVLFICFLCITVVKAVRSFVQ